MRRKPPETVPDLNPRSGSSTIVMERDYRLLTPLYGGGVEAGKVDTTTPIHGTGIRGQLRFWWRATRGGLFNGDRRQLKAAEDRIWGSTESGSQVAIAVTRPDPGSVLTLPKDKNGKPVYVGSIGSPYSYVAFPLRPQDGKPAGTVHEGVTFSLELSFPKAISDDVQAALWAWEMFGGVGARTRRGFGVVHCTDVRAGAGSAAFAKADWQWVYDCRQARTKLLEHVMAFVAEGPFPEDVAHLSRDKRRYKVTTAGNNAMERWENLFGALRDFRQDRSGKFGRSKWPEPDAIRFLTHQPTHLPVTRRAIYSPRIDKFPRAAFGLPIIFEFKGGAYDASQSNMEPRKTTLTLADHERLASPLILRPLPCGQGQFVGLALILDGIRIPPGQLQLKEIEVNGRLIANVAPDLTAGEATLIDGKHSKKISNDILQSFLDSL